MLSLTRTGNSLTISSISTMCAGVTGNGGCYGVQKEAFEEGADLLIATTSSDEINILSCLVAKKIGTTAYHCPQSAIRNMPSSCGSCGGELGLSMVINPEQATARGDCPCAPVPPAPSSGNSSACAALSSCVEYRIGPGDNLWWATYPGRICTITSGVQNL